MKDTLRPGLTASLTYLVPATRTVPHLLPESPEFTALPDVLATGYLVGLVEWACIRATNPHLDPGELTLGTQVDLSHEAPSPPGSTISIEVELVTVQSRRLEFSVLARDATTVLCRGRHRRAVVERRRFEQTAAGNGSGRAAKTADG